MMMGGCSMSWMMFGMGVVAFALLMLIVLGIAALVKCLRR